MKMILKFMAMKHMQVTVKVFLKMIKKKWRIFHPIVKT